MEDMRTTLERLKTNQMIKTRDTTIKSINEKCLGMMEELGYLNKKYKKLLKKHKNLEDRVSKIENYLKNNDDLKWEDK